MIVSVTRCWNKSSPKYTNCCPKINHRWFYLKSDTFRKSPKSHRTLGLLLEKKPLLRTFKNRPIWSHWWLSRVLFCFVPDKERSNAMTKAEKNGSTGSGKSPTGSRSSANSSESTITDGRLSRSSLASSVATATTSQKDKSRFVCIDVLDVINLFHRQLELSSL